MRRRSMLLAFLAALLLAACGTPAAVREHRQALAPPPTRTPAPPTATDASDTDAIKAGIQRTLDRHGTAYTTNDIELLKTTVDNQNLPFRRFVLAQFDDYQRSFQGGMYTFTYTVDEVQPRDHGFVLARVISGGGYVHSRGELPLACLSPLAPYAILLEMYPRRGEPMV